MKPCIVTVYRTIDSNERVCRVSWQDIEQLITKKPCIVTVYRAIDSKETVYRTMDSKGTVPIQTQCRASTRRNRPPCAEHAHAAAPRQCNGSCRRRWHPPGEMNGDWVKVEWRLGGGWVKVEWRLSEGWMKVEWRLSEGWVKVEWKWMEMC